MMVTSICDPVLYPGPEKDVSSKIWIKTIGYLKKKKKNNYRLYHSIDPKFISCDYGRECTHLII